MGRLTNHFDYCAFIDCKWRNAELEKVNQCDFFNMTSRDKCHDKAIYEKLREYEEAEEQGLLLRLPCKNGDVVWAIRNYKGIKHVQKGFVNEMFFTQEMKLCIVVKNVARGFWGETIFLTQEEAEKALAERGKE